MKTLRALLRNPQGALGLILCSLVLFAAVFGPEIAPKDPETFHFNARFAAPSLEFPLGDTADMLRDTVQSFASDHIAPRASEIDPLGRKAYGEVKRLLACLWCCWLLGWVPAPGACFWPETAEFIS
mgnify:CR=1 FL=1